MNSKNPAGSTVAHEVAHELREYFLISVYLYVCFGALLLYKTSILHDEGVNYEPYGIAAIKAVILGKFILLGQAAGIGDRYELRSPIRVIIHKSFLFLLMLFALSALEEVVGGIIHGRTIAASLNGFLGGSILQVLAICLIMLLILIPYLAFKEISRRAG